MMSMNEMTDAAMFQIRLMIVARIKPKCSPPRLIDEMRAARAPSMEIASAGPKSRPATQSHFFPRNMFRYGSVMSESICLPWKDFCRSKTCRWQILRAKDDRREMPCRGGGIGQ